MASSTGIAIFSWWYGNTPDRAMALVFSITWLIGLIVTLFAFTSKSYKNLSQKYLESK
jgi:DHA3 family multidrug efflux protein-like MFS transporter